MIRHYPITPIPAPRQVRSHAWKPTPGVLRYRAFRDEVRVRGVDLPAAGADILFLMPMPPSWTKKKARARIWTPHEQKPDTDNLLKALTDAIHGEDCHIWNYRSLSKIWAPKGGIIIRVSGSAEREAKSLVEQLLECLTPE